MKKHPIADILDHVLIPLIAYLLAGCMVLNLWDYPVNKIYYIVWGIMAGIILGIREYFANKPVTVGLALYTALLTVWLVLFGGDNGWLHAAMVIVGLCAIALLQILFRKKVIKIIFGYSMLILLIGLEIADVSFPKGVIALAIVLFLNAVSETLSFFHSEHAPSFLAIFVMIAAITVVTPAPEEPYNWNFVVKTINSIEEVLDNMVYEIQYQLGKGKSDGIFHYGYTGFTDSAISLSTSLTDHDMIQLVVEGNRTKRNLYLRGNICDSYTGSSWETTLQEETLSCQTDTLMTLYAIFSKVQDKSELEKFMEVKEQSIVMQGIRTQSLFYPLKLLNTTVADVQPAGDNFRRDKRSAEGDTYSYRFLDIDYASPQLIEMMQGGADLTYNEETYDLIFAKMQEYYNIQLEKVPFSRFLKEVSEGQKKVEEQYTTPGDAVTDKVRQLADDITENCKSDYDKCKALEAYLYQYDYDKVISVPDDVNILDWFLFEGKEGYCVHYATALAAMLRCEGIPARLAEGFLVDYQNNTDFYSFSVSGTSAHVWVEAYIEGFGWIRLEPTVVNAGYANLVWYEDTAAEESSDEIWDMYLEDESDMDGTETEDADLDETELNPEEEQGASEEESEEIWFLVIKLLGGLAVSIIIILLVQVLYVRIVIRNSNNPDVIFRHILSLLRKKYSPKKGDETVREYFERISGDGRLSAEKKEKLGRLLEIMEEYWYGAGDVKEDDIKIIKEIRDDFQKREKSE